jgi:uncharacterized membrane protein HdeD (DUF308 family)
MSKIEASQPLADIGKQALIEVINRTLKGVDTTVNFLSQQIPDVIHQLLLYKAVSSFLMCLVAIALCIIHVSVTRVVYKIETKQKSSDAFVSIGIVGMLCGVFVWGIALRLLCLNMDWLQIWLAPKVYLLEYAANLYKAGR